MAAGVARLNHCPVKKACSPPELQDSSQELAPFLAASPSWQELPYQAEFKPAVHPLGRPVAVPLLDFSGPADLAAWLEEHKG